MKKIILLRHGQSEWNRENRFTGWVDIGLSERGIEEAREAGRWLRHERYLCDHAYTSYLSRAIHTLNYVLEELDQEWIPVEKSWRLNERHYGALQGLNKADMVKHYGEQQVMQWRRGYDTAPDPLAEDDPLCPWYDRRYEHIPLDELPRTESLKDTIARIAPYWKRQIIPSLYSVDCLLVVAHGNSLRGIIKELKHLTNEQVVALNVPTGVPYVFEFDRHLRPVKDFYVGDPELIGRRIAAAAEVNRPNEPTSERL